jgi:hypothetical protein
MPEISTSYEPDVIHLTSLRETDRQIDGYRRLFDINDTSLAHPYADPDRIPVSPPHTPSCSPLSLLFRPPLVPRPDEGIRVQTRCSAMLNSTKGLAPSHHLRHHPRHHHDPHLGPLPPILLGRAFGDSGVCVGAGFDYYYYEHRQGMFCMILRGVEVR